MNFKLLKNFLDEKVDYYNTPDFIAGDPISVPHEYSKRQDIEIAGFFAAVFACRSPSPSADSLVERFQFFYSDLLGKCKCVRSQRESESESASNYCYQ